LLTPSAVLADTQSNKNTWRNLGIAGAAVAGYGLLNHNSTATVLGLAGAGYSAYRYEQDRHHQSQQNAWRNRAYYHRSYYHRYNPGYSTYRTSRYHRYYHRTVRHY
jgi:hypothetical protein